MSNLGRRLRRLEVVEQVRQGKRRTLDREALGRLSDEDLAALEVALEEGVRMGARTFEDLYAVASESSRRALKTYFDLLEAIERGEPVGEPEERTRAPTGRDGYRIWDYREKGRA